MVKMTNEPLHGTLGRLILQTLPAGPLHIKSDTPPRSGWLDEQRAVPDENVSGGRNRRNRRDLTRLSE